MECLVQITFEELVFNWALFKMISYVVAKNCKTPKRVAYCSVIADKEHWRIIWIVFTGGSLKKVTAYCFKKG